MSNKSIISSYRLPAELHRFFKEWAYEVGLSRNELIKQWLRDAMDLQDEATIMAYNPTNQSDPPTDDDEETCDE